MEYVQPFKFKICLIGESRVGKTSLIRRFVNNSFEDKYLTTLGTKISVKEINGYKFKKNISINAFLIIWDIVGQHSFRHLFSEAYYKGVNGIIAVCDLTRKDTLLELNNWMENARHQTGEEVPTMFLGNKSDLVDKQQLDLDDIGKLASYYGHSEAFITSAKTGENVENAFNTLLKFMLE